MGKPLMIVGTYALYAYEMNASVVIANDLLATNDIDLLFNIKSKLKIFGDFPGDGFIGLLKQIDDSFKWRESHSYSAVNNHDFMVELIKSTSANLIVPKKQKLTDIENDLTAAEIEQLIWLINSPKMHQIVISERIFRTLI